MTLTSRTDAESVTPSSDTDATRSYEVLYYKRKNKVHKSKGVSKMDGRLTVSPAPSCIVQLTDDGNDKVYSGIQREVAKQNLQVDDTVVVGQYEVQIVRILNQDAENDVSNNKTNNAHSQKPHAKPFPSKTSLLPSKRPLSTFTSKSAPQSTSIKPLVSKPLWQTNRRPPPQPKKRAAANDSDEDKSNDEEAVPTASLPPVKRNPLLSKKRTLTPMARTTAPTASFTQVSSLEFPGVIGNVVVPPSICKVLRPHQTEGVAFLWNCLTGQSPTLQQAAKDAGTTGPVAGAVLADEMVSTECVAGVVNVYKILFRCSC